MAGHRVRERRHPEQPLPRPERDGAGGTMDREVSCREPPAVPECATEIPPDVRRGLLCGLGTPDPGAVRPPAESAPMAVGPLRRIRDLHPTPVGGTSNRHPRRILRVEHHLPERDELACRLAVRRDRAWRDRSRVLDAFVASTTRSEM